MTTEMPIHFIHISDTHIGSQKDFLQYELNTYDCFDRFLKGINKLNFKPDFIIHTGDIVAEPNEASYKLTQSLADKTDIPIYFTAGNHDDSELIRRFLKMHNVEYLDDELLSYSFTFNNTEFISLDTSGYKEIDPQGLISDKQLYIIRKALANANKSVVIFLHFAPVDTGIPWLDKNMSLLNREKLVDIFIENRKKLRGVFFGHIHSSFDIFYDNIFYSGVGSLYRQFKTWPNLNKAELENKHAPHFNCVTLDRKLLTVKHCSIDLLSVT